MTGVPADRFHQVMILMNLLGLAGMALGVLMLIGVAAAEEWLRRRGSKDRRPKTRLRCDQALRPRAGRSDDGSAPVNEQGQQRGHMPSSVTPDRGRFDRFAEWVSGLVSRAWFFAACVLLIVLWAPSYPIWRSGDTYQLVVNTGTTIVTFLLVALLQNSQKRDSQANQHKLNAIAAGVATLLEHADLPYDEATELDRAAVELRCAVGLEEREST